MPGMVGLGHAIAHRADRQDSNPGSAETCESHEAAFEPPPWFVRIYGQRNGKPSPPMTQVPDVQAMPLGVRYHPPAPCMGAA
jgi:hypothetical protein